MSYKCEILADSKNPQGDRITTMKITFPRFILAEFNTHRMFSRNSASSRAIPFKKMVKMVEENPFIPIAWQKDHKGMQGTEYIDQQDEIEDCISVWLKARDNAVKQANLLGNTEGFTKVTKQLCNRLLEPFMWHTVIVTATEWENFFNLRCPQYEHWFYNDDGSQDYDIYKSKKDFIKAKGSYAKFYSIDSKKYEEMSNVDWLRFNKSQADIHIQAIAELMWDTMNESTPKQLQAGEWHIPFGDKIEGINFSFQDTSDNQWTLKYNRLFDGDSIAIKIATARCARISYQTLGNNPKIDYEADLRLHDILAKSGHWSPFEHVARAMHDWEYNSYVIGQADMFDDPDDGIAGFSDSMLGWCRNFRGFIQYRSLIDHE